MLQIKYYYFIKKLFSNIMKQVTRAYMKLVIKLLAKHKLLFINSLRRIQKDRVAISVIQVDQMTSFTCNPSAYCICIRFCSPKVFCLL